MMDTTTIWNICMVTHIAMMGNMVIIMIIITTITIITKIKKASIIKNIITIMFTGG